MSNILLFKKLSIIILSLIILTNSSMLSQVPIIDENAVVISFDGFNGSGFSPDPATGQLNSDTWSVLGLSDGDLNFGDTGTEGDFAMGISSGKVSTGGCYAFDIGSGNIALGFQPTGSDWTPGDLILKIQNNTGNNIITLTLSYSLWVYNDKPRANSFNFSHSPDNSIYTSEPALDFTSPETADGTPSWTDTIMDIDLNDLNIPDGSNYYLKWTGDDFSGSGYRDEFAIDNISITATLGEADTDPPTISTYDPVNGAIDIAVNKILGFSFDEDVQKGSGNIVVRYSSDDTEFETMDVNEPEVVVTGTDVTIDLVGDFDEDKEYYVLIDAGTFKDMANNNFVGISDPATWKFTTIDETPPEFIETYPETTNESNTQFDIVVQLNEVGHIYYIVVPDDSKIPDKDQVKEGVDYDTVILVTSGSFEVTAPGTGFNTTVSGLDADTSYDVYLVAEDDATTPNLQDIPVKVEVTTTSNPTLELTYPTGGETFYHGDTVEVTWNSEFIDNVRLYRYSDGPGYFIMEESADAATRMLELIVPNNAGTDDLLIRIASVLDTTLYDESGYFHLIDTLDPEIDSLYPENAEIDVGPGRNLEIHFSENVFPGTGNVTIKRLSDSSTFEEIDVTDIDLVTVEEEQVNIDPANDLDEGITYFVEIDKGAFVDEVDSAFAGISGSSYWTFTTADYTAPVFMPGYPTISNVRDTSVDIVVKMDEVCLVYYLISEVGAPEPTIGEVKAGNSISGSTIETSAMVSGLKPGTAYDIYFVAEDDATIPNTQNTVTKVDVTTPFTLELTSPSGGEVYYIGNSLTVTWISANIDSILLEEYDFNTMDYLSIVDEFDVTIGEFTFVIPVYPKKDSMKIRISAVDNPNVFDESGIFYIMDNLPPVIDSLVPSDSATNVSLYSRVKIYFNENIKKGAGTISIVKKPDTTIFETFDITGDSVYLEGKKIILYPSQPFDPNTEYYVIIDSAAIKDMAGNAFPGIFNDITYNFKTIRSELYISEYMEGSSFNKAIELYNNSGTTVDLSGYALWIIYNGGDWSEGESNAVILEGSLEHEDVFVICNSKAGNDILSVADSVGSQAASFNGNDAIGLAKKVDEEWILIDLVGTEGEDNVTGWEVAGVPEATMSHTLLRKTSVQMGNTNWTTSAGTNTGDSEWRVFGQDFIGNLGEPTPDGNSETEILTMELYDTNMYNITTNVSIDSLDYTVEVEVLYGTEPDFLIPVFTLSDGATIDPGSGDTLDFTYPVTFTVIAEDSLTIKEWTITVNVETVPDLSIYDIQYTTNPSGDSPHLGEKVRVSGIVTAIDTSQSLFKGFFLQETTKAWNGIYVYDPGRDSTQMADSLTLVATILEQDNMTRISDIIEYIVNSKDNNLTAPLELTTGEAGEEQYEGVLISIENAECIDSIPGSGEFELDDGSGLIRVDNYLYPYEPFILNNIYHVTGVMYYSDGNWKIFPRTAEDISNVTAINETGFEKWINIFPNPNNGRFNLEITGNYSFEAEIQIMNTLGQVVYRSYLNSSSNHRTVIDLPNFTKGLYFLKVSNGTHVMVRKILIR